ncbi:hypothetical protein IWX78_002091 [Mycetocola sp. CAN_C7]
MNRADRLFAPLSAAACIDAGIDAAQVDAFTATGITVIVAP